MTTAPNVLPFTPPAPAPAPTPPPFDREGAIARLAELCPDLEGDPLDKVLAILAAGSPWNQIRFIPARFPSGETLPSLTLAQYSMRNLAALAGSGELEINIRGKRGYGGKFRLVIDEAWSRQSPVSPALPAPAQPAGGAGPDPNAQLLGKVLDRLEALESRMVRSVGEPAPTGPGGMIEMIKTIGGMMGAMRELTVPQQKDGLLGEIAKIRELKAFIREEANELDGGGAAVEDSGLVKTIIEAAGPHLPKLIDALSTRIQQQPTPQQPRPVANQSRRPQRPRPSPSPAPESRPVSRVPKPQSPAPAPATQHTPEQIDQAIYQLLSPIAQSFPAEMLVPMILKNINARVPAADAADAIVSVCDEDALVDWLEQHKPGELGSAIACHSRLNEHAQYIADLETELRNLFELADDDDEEDDGVPNLGDMPAASTNESLIPYEDDDEEETDVPAAPPAIDPNSVASSEDEWARKMGMKPGKSWVS